MYVRRMHLPAVVALVSMLSTGAAAEAQSNDVIISEYVEGSSLNKAIELFNPTAASIDLSGYTLSIYFNGNSTANTVLALSGTLAPGETFVIADDGADADVLAVADLSPGNSFFNGDDAIVLSNAAAVVDSFGQVGVDPGSAWSGGGVSAQNQTLRRNGCVADTDPSDPFDPSLEWLQFPQDTFTGLGAHDCAGGGGGTPGGECGESAVLIHAVQGAGFSTPLDGQAVTVEGVITGDFPGNQGLRGFFMQEEDADADADPATSESLFVYFPGNTVDVAPGDQVRVHGTASEYFGLTQVSAQAVTVCTAGAGLPAASNLSLPVASAADLEALEGMLVSVPQMLYAIEQYNLGRYGEVGLSVTDHLPTPTQVVAPGVEAHDLQTANKLGILQLDDGSSVENPLPLPPYLGPDLTLRSGDTVTGLTGVLGYAFSAWELHPTEPVAFSRENPRAADPPEVGGALRVASFNVLNYFVTFGGPGDRGADDADEFARQRDKIINALAALDADVVGLIEIQNNDAAIVDLVDGLNAVVGAGAYDYLDTGAIGTDAIKNAFIYRTSAVAPVGGFAVLDESVDPRAITTKNRPALAQTFVEQATGEVFTAAINHFKSKGSACDTPATPNELSDPDTGDGQGNCNLTRLSMANALSDWLAGDPTGSGDPDFLVLGDLNSYAMEDPIAALQQAGYEDLARSFEGDGVYSYVFQGQWGTLDYALANGPLSAQTTGAAVWHINADEPRALDYNNFNQPGLYQPDPFRASDHDPVVVGLSLSSTPRCRGVEATIYVDGDGNVVGGPLDGRPYRGTLVGTPADDVIVGTPGADRIIGATGRDLICGHGGEDRIIERGTIAALIRALIEFLVSLA